MLSRLITAVFCLALVQSASAQSVAAYEAVRGSMAKLMVASGTGRYFSGSGVVLPGGRLVTNCHVTQFARTIVLSRGTASERAQTQSIDVFHDLCLLDFPDLRMQPARLRKTSDLQLGETVYAIGFNYGQGLTYEEGRIEELFPLDGGYVIRTSAAFSTGASGGGLFDVHGNLIGILTFFRVATNRDLAYFAVPVEWIDGAVARQPQPVAPLVGAPFWAESFEQQPHFLKAATLEVEGKWPELLALARAWTQANPHDGHAWAHLGRGLRRAGRNEDANEAFRRAAERGVAGASLP